MRMHASPLVSKMERGPAKGALKVFETSQGREKMNPMLIGS